LSAPKGYDIVGEGEALLAFPALGCDWRMWAPLQDELAGDYRFIVPRLWEYDSLVEGASAARTALDELGIEKVLLAGLSMGGYAALEFIRLFADRVSGVILCDTTAFPDSEERRIHREDTLSVIADGGYERVLSLFLDSVVWAGGESVVKVRKLMAKMAFDIGKEGYVRSLKAIKDRGDQSEILKGFTLPLLFIVGSEDAFTPPSVAEEMAEKFGGSGLSVIPGAGHMSVLENAVAAADAAQNFIDSIT